MANVKISELVAATLANGADEVELLQAGTNKRGSLTVLAKGIIGLHKYVEVIGNSSLIIIPVTHNLNTRDVIVSVRRTATPYDQVSVDNDATDLNTVTFTFSSAPGTGEYTVTIFG